MLEESSEPLLFLFPSQLAEPVRLTQLVPHSAVNCSFLQLEPSLLPSQLLPMLLLPGLLQLLTVGRLAILLCFDRGATLWAAGTTEGRVVG